MGKARKPPPAWAVRLRAEREARFWSQKEMARQLYEAAPPEVQSTFPSRASVMRELRDWEAGRWKPGSRYKRLYALAFGIDESVLFGDTFKLPGKSPEEVLATILPGSDSLAPLATRAGRRIGETTIEDLAARVHSMRLADDILGGEDLIVPAFRELDAAVRLYREATHTEETGWKLLAVIGESAQIAGWIASDAGQHEQAAQAYGLGISAAKEAGDAVLESNLIGSLAYQVSNVGDMGSAVVLAHAAVKAAPVHSPPRARALAWDRLAWAHARNSDAQAAMRALGEASDALASDRGQPGPGYLYWVDAGELQVMEARVYTELRRPLRAVPLLTDVLARYNTTHTRELALYLSWLAVALADANEPEEAAHQARRMLEMSADVASDRTHDRSLVVLNKLTSYADVPQVRELLADFPVDG
ncbi:tetratricopeptide (TPR) repeat protein [Nonomuraea thailandensis]|uniref:Tetratricopeptide (TPR) repeat protein n=1 Tax=Nonomuraea thailandensis TaxID=1188745 RepID=A0A9X2K110_9ACTN|nr:transcriptional regulator [Nonomuraea thailandensis]MCP2353051.1 tetratricopeptide (TPR) repeat protein [Nonomuraea thailandensis]